MHAQLGEWNKERQCGHCKESWFDQKIGPKTGLCQRCNQLKYRENDVPRFSVVNDMIPGEVQQCIKILNQVELSAICLIIPYIHFFKRKNGSHGASGHCIAFEQKVDHLLEQIISLPRAVSLLPIIVIERSDDNHKKQFKANRQYIIDALKWLVQNNPEYRHMIINYEVLNEYPESGGNVEGIRRIIDDENLLEVSETNPVASDEDRDRLCAAVAAQQEDDDGDIPRPNSTVGEALSKGIVNEHIKKAVDSIQVGGSDESSNNPVLELLQSSEPASEFMPGFFSKAFPHLFPDGKGDFTKPRLGNQPTFMDWAKHLMRYDRRFANDPIFPLVVTNIYQRRQTLTLGNLYAQRHMGHLSVKELREKLDQGGHAI
ncbi:hypothetical protein GWK47_005544 [Chionoecetes opilio]|uniref:DUF6570 domain-containing protein n=1 Tax=Chionoecetes opilio TaxID=41210 RepID=A0A8J5CJM2_CHIOP|nr:hypothetical protein GWK47_005544 [Chionoecetes opilio]